MSLILTRKPGQVLRFPELGIEITVADCRRSGVKLSIDAPRAIRVLRGELAEFDRGEEVEAA